MIQRALISLWCLLYFIPFWGRVQEPTFCKTFVYDERVHDFGTIEEAKGKVSHTFTFTNEGSEPVSISDIRLWCGCTEASFTKNPIRPGEYAKVTLTYNPAYRPGKFSKETVVLLNEGKSYTRIWIKGDVVAMEHPVTEDHPYHLGEGLYVSHLVLPFGAIQPGSTDSLRLLIANGSDHNLKVEFIRTPDNRLLQMPRKLVLKAGERKKLYAKYTARYLYNHRRQITLTPVINGKEGKPIHVTWQANGVKAKR